MAESDFSISADFHGFLQHTLSKPCTAYGGVPPWTRGVPYAMIFVPPHGQGFASVLGQGAFRLHRWRDIICKFGLKDMLHEGYGPQKALAERRRLLAAVSLQEVIHFRLIKWERSYPRILTMLDEPQHGADPTAQARYCLPS